jgi:mannitol 2-dehydrogenase
MSEIIKLNARNLSKLPHQVVIPSYDRSNLKTGIVHIGIGGFHRAHQAFYMDKLLENYNAADWAICAIGLLETDRKIYEVLVRQDGLYTLMINESDGSLSARIIGSIVEYIFAPENTEAALEKLANPQVKVITLTITEGGYNFSSATGEFQLEEASIQNDLNNPQNPKTVFGYLTQALKRRRERGITGLTIQSCDNIQKNGKVLKKMLLAFLKEAEPGLIGWVEKNIAFPDSMVDRITPVTRQSDIQKLKAVFGFEDEWPVVCEPFIQWVIEDNFSNGRPEWELVGAKMVKDVSPYEKMKIRLLNAGHSLLGFLGSLYGCTTIDEALKISILGTFLRKFMDIEVTPVLGKFEDINLDEYKDSLIQRFANPNIRDQLSRICMESSAKIPKFVLPTIKEQLERGGSIKRGVTIIAAWCRYLELAESAGNNYQIEDKMAIVLRNNALASMTIDPLAFIKTEIIFGDLALSDRFVYTYLPIIDSLRKFGIEKTIWELD